MNIGLLVLVNILWATQWTAYKLVGDEMGPITVNFFAFLIATPISLALYFAQRWKGAQTFPAVPPSERSLRRWDNLIGFLVVGVLGVVATSVLMAWGMTRTTASNGALLTLTIPVITALLAAAFLHERMSWTRWASLAIALMGVLILSITPTETAAKEGLTIDWRDLRLFHTDFVVGNLLILGSCVNACLYNVGSKGLLKRFSSLEVLTFGYIVALATLGAMLPWFEPFSASRLATYSVRTWTGLSLLGGVAWGLAMVLWLFVLTRLDVSQASISVYLLPFFGVVVAAVSLHEQITLPMIVGGTITLAGTILVVSKESTA
jgi:drug/metabolite transporter (DMT)-like permease